MKLHYHGHSCFEIETNNYRILIDPFISGNDKAKVKPEDLKPDFILLTHGHGDHVGDTVSIAKQNDALVVAPHELSVWLSWQGVRTHGMSTGGSFEFPFGRLKMTHALHGSGFELGEKKEIVYMGPASGYLLTLEGKTIYHAGDTALFSDMKIINHGKAIDLALLPIGDNFTMGPDDAVIAAEWLNAKQVVPMHYNTFPVIEQDPHAFVKKLEEKGIKGIALAIGESLEI